jgi:hypothetical protein
MNDKNNVDETSKLMHAMRRKIPSHTNIFMEQVIIQGLSAASYHHQNLNVPAHIKVKVTL